VYKEAGMCKKILLFIFMLLLASELYALTVDSIVKGIGRVETEGSVAPVNAVGDLKLKNRAYGIYQLRQPAVDDVNRVFGFQGINKANELLGDAEKQKLYATLYVKILRQVFDTWEEVIDAYNQGIGNVQRGRPNPNTDYVKKVKKWPYYISRA
jgi:soluble lytic murein transglycosylase-like protein